MPGTGTPAPPRPPAPPPPHHHTAHTPICTQQQPDDLRADGELEYEHLAGGIKAALEEDAHALDAEHLACIDGDCRHPPPFGASPRPRPHRHPHKQTCTHCTSLATPSHGTQVGDLHPASPCPARQAQAARHPSPAPAPPPPLSRACTPAAGPGVRRLLRWKHDLPQQEERARLLREVRASSGFPRPTAPGLRPAAAGFAGSHGPLSMAPGHHPAAIGFASSHGPLSMGPRRHPQLVSAA
jgi:hypothetical protein